MSGEAGNAKGWTFDTLATAGALVALGIVIWIGTMSAERAKAVNAALASANKMADMHNDLIRKGERDASRYITRGNIYSALGTALAVLALVIAYNSSFGG